MRPEFLPDLVRTFLRRWGPNLDPPEQLVTEVLALAKSFASRVLSEVDRDEPRGFEGLEQLVIAFGLGWRRRTDPPAWHDPASAWTGVWDKTRLWLEGVARSCVKRTSGYLAFGLSIEGYAYREHPDVSPAVVQRLVLWLIEGKCPCPNLFSEDPEADRANRRVGRCHRDHWIGAWNPQACLFLDFVWQAIKGPKPHRDRRLGDFSPKALVQGMHFWNLHKESHLRFADVLVWICSIDGTRNFEGLPCLECLNAERGKVLDPDAFRTVVQRLIIPSVWAGRYVEESYWNCQHCRRLTYPGNPFFPGTHYYPSHLESCPKCRQRRGPGAKRSHVYLLTRREGRLLEPYWATPTAQPDSRYADLRSALGELEPSARRILTLKFIEELTPIEVALEMQITPKEAERLEAAAMKQLAALLNLNQEENE